MIKTSANVKERIKLLGKRVAQLQSLGNGQLAAVRDPLSELQAEQAAWKLLLITRKLQMHDKVIDLARWRDGFAAGPYRAEFREPNDRRPVAPSGKPRDRRIVT